MNAKNIFVFLIFLAIASPIIAAYLRREKRREDREKRHRNDQYHL